MSVRLISSRGYDEETVKLALNTWCDGAPLWACWSPVPIPVELFSESRYIHFEDCGVYYSLYEDVLCRLHVLQS